MRQYFEHIYEGFCGSVRSLIDLAEIIAEASKVIFVYITMPIWIIPYAIWRNRKGTETEDRTCGQNEN